MPYSAHPSFAARAKNLLYRYMLAGSLLCMVSVFVLFPSSTYADETAPEGFVTVTLKFLRTKGGTTEEPVTLDSFSCPPCRQKFDPDYSRQNRKETIVALQVPRERNLDLSFSASPRLFDRVILQTRPVSFTIDGRHLRLSLPPLVNDATEAGEFATNIVGEGFVLRFEHGDPDRRFGAYAKLFPERQRLAANNLEFALREAVLDLGLGRRALETHAGIIEIMGFDTNDPHGHRDAPPHIHMHLRWPYNIGTQIGHFYLDEAGRIDHTVVGIAGLGGHKEFTKSQIFVTLDSQGRPFFSETITPDGGLTVADPFGHNCWIGAPGDDFSRELHVACQGHPPVLIRVADDRSQGVLTVESNDLKETFHYDAQTGLLLSPNHPPEAEPSDIVPTLESLASGHPLNP
ncbi:hypothetical protein Gbfr_015_009 [Gluconobacter frateurii M-2]|nr:hypothetical protein Gbfr_015_009 [Gluconobacter frateurii M-2]